MMVCVGPEGAGGPGEGQGCVYNVNMVKATDMKGRGRERGGPHPVPYILFQLFPLYFYYSPKGSACAVCKMDRDPSPTN